jgi:hypothetical protein
MSKLQQTTGQAGGAKNARANPVTPADVKPIWGVLEEPLSRSVAEWFTARGRPISAATVLEWKRAGWPDTSTADIAKAPGVAGAKAEKAAAVNGDVGINRTTVIAPSAKAEGAQKIAPLDHVGNAELAERALRAALTCATAVLESIRNIATAPPVLRAAGDTSERRSLLEEEADSIARLTAAASKSIDVAVEGLRQLAVWRAENAAAVPSATGSPSRH